MEDRWTPEHVLSLAPDVSSGKAAAKLSGPASWSAEGSWSAERSEGSVAGAAVWGECKGSGSTPYRTVVDLSGPAFHCTCPSRKFPCKHALALLLRWSGGAAGQVADGSDVPGWAEGWLTARRSKSEQQQEKQQERQQQREEAAEPEAAEPEAVEPDGAARAAAERRLARRSARVAAGASELEARLADRIRSGLADAPGRGYAGWGDVAARMVDAQAPGLAARVRELGAVPGSGTGWPARLLEEYGLLHLLAVGYGQVDLLPEQLAATVRSRVGFTVDAADLLRGPLLRDSWLVLGSRDSADDRLTTRRIWLRGHDSGRDALLLAFGRPGTGPDLALPTGLRLDAELAFHPGVRPLRATLGTRYAAPAAPAAAETEPEGLDLTAALDAYGRALGDDPWLESWPVVLRQVVPAPTAIGWELADPATAQSIPVDRRPVPDSGLWRLLSVSGGRPLTLFGECGHRGFTPVTAWYQDDGATRTLAVTQLGGRP
ncbi:SWIM zinc finger family protein [Streptacidiphilus carbonis]|uniref:SWIM zinc finger family protein n=1 Tax=Streptacidiphilus carbonis TaxID=105422 RepID=UPI0005A9BA93|nr:SWIM zinc finger family protein [Streptacidiphilus carbonis]